MTYHQLYKDHQHLPFCHPPPPGPPPAELQITNTFSQPSHLLAELRLRIPRSLAKRVRCQFLRLGLDAPAQLGVDPGEHLIRPPPDGLFGAAEMSRHITHEIILLARLLAEDVPEHGGLNKVFVRDGQLLRHCRAGPFLVFLRRLDGLVGHVAVGGGVVWIGAVVAVDGHDAVTLVGVECVDGLVDRDLLVVDTEAVAVGVRIGEQAGLEDGIGGGFDAGDHVRGRECDLFDLGEVVLRVAVEGEFAEAPEWDVFLGPDFGEVEDVPAEFLSLFGREDLEVAGP